MDCEGLERVLVRIHAGELRLLTRDSPEPSPLAHEILNARPYAFLDDAPLEERRTQAVLVRRATDPSSAADLGALDPDAIDRVRDEERPDPRDADELHDALMLAGLLTLEEAATLPASLFDTLVGARRATRVALDGRRAIWIAAERLPEVLAVHPNATSDRVVVPPARHARVWARADAIVEIVRGRLSLVGPVTAAELAESLAVAEEDVRAALLDLEGQGIVLRGRFRARSQPRGARSAPARERSGAKGPPRATEPGCGAEPHESLEWCDRRLLARIHRYTLNRLRAEIEPVSPADFMRFLFAWQHVEAASRLTGLDGLREVLAILDGVELPARAWERAVLPARVDRYDKSMLDMLCLTGEAGWARLSGARADSTDAGGDEERGARAAILSGSTPIALVLREHADAWHALRAVDPERQRSVERRLSANASAALVMLRERGALFFRELMLRSGLTDAAVWEALGQLAAAGLVTSDGFAGVRAVARAQRQSKPAAGGQHDLAGRWSAAGGPETGGPETGGLETQISRETAVEVLARTLLRRYGVVFRRLLTRETGAPTWRELVMVYRRLEARGEIRGGRFVAGMAGEQFAWPDAVERLREVRRQPRDGSLVTLSAADPLNLTGIVTSGDRIRVAISTRLAYRDGVPVAVMEGDYLRPLADIDPALASDVARALAGRRVPALITGFVGR